MISATELGEKIAVEVGQWVTRFDDRRVVVSDEALGTIVQPAPRLDTEQGPPHALRPHALQSPVSTWWALER